MVIPVRNLYYLLSYAWNRIRECQQVSVDIENNTELLDLFVRVLISGLNQLSRHSLDRDYQERRECLSFIRGRIEFNETLKIFGLNRGQIVCDYDKITSDTLSNQIIKATLHNLLRIKLDQKLSNNLRRHIREFCAVSDIHLQSHDFNRIVINSNNRFCGFLIDICQLIHKKMLPSNEPGQWKFLEFMGNDKEMGHLFETFVRNFYRHHLGPEGVNVGRERITWKWQTYDSEARELLPQMETDIRLETAGEKILIECKFGLVTKQNQYESEKLISSHLYQINSYLTQLPDSKENRSCHMILLYPSSGIDRNFVYKSGNRKISVVTINLNDHWVKIHGSLLELVKNLSPSQESALAVPP